MPSAQNTIALLFTNLATFHANSKSCNCCGVGCFLGHHLHVIQAQLVGVSGLHQQARAHAFDIQQIQTIRPRRVAARRQRDLQHAYIRFGLQLHQGLTRERRRDQHFHELLRQRLHCGQIDRAIESDDATEGRCWVGLVSLFVSGQSIFSHGHTARVGVFHNHTSRCVKTLDAFPGRVRVCDVVVRQFLALQLTRGDE
jgi:hypothetical protein